MAVHPWHCTGCKAEAPSGAYNPNSLQVLWPQAKKEHHRAPLSSSVPLILLNEACINKFQIIKNLGFILIQLFAVVSILYFMCEHEYALHKLFYLKMELWETATSLPECDLIVSSIIAPMSSTTHSERISFKDVQVSSYNSGINKF